MQTINLKRPIRKYFSKKVNDLAPLTGKSTEKEKSFAESDYFELLVLVRLAEQYEPNVVPRNLKNGRYMIALSPSESLKAASYFEVGDPSTGQFAIRTGLEVQVFTPAGEPTGTVELDIIAASSKNFGENDKLPGQKVIAAFECKLHGKRLTSDHANTLIGKARRVWIGLPLHPIAGEVERYSLVTLDKGISENGRLGLLAEGIGVYQNEELDEFLPKLVHALAKEAQT